MKKTIIVCILFILLGGCLDVEGIIHHNKISKAKNAVLERLVDPESAHFKDIKIKNSVGFEWIVSGEVNSKNRMGGYGGFQRFIYTKSGLFDFEGEPGFEHLWKIARLEKSSKELEPKASKTRKDPPVATPSEADRHVEEMERLIRNEKYNEAIQYGSKFSWSSGNEKIKNLQKRATALKESQNLSYDTMKSDKIASKVELLPVTPSNITKMRSHMENEQYQEALEYAKQFHWNSQMKKMESKAKEELGLKWYE